VAFPEATKIITCYITIFEELKMRPNKILKVFVYFSLILNTQIFAQSDPIITQSTSSSTTTSYSDSKTTVHSPPPSAIAPAVTVINNDVCAVAASGAVQTQILGISMGGTTTDYNCERLKLSKTLFDMGMKVAAVATMCQDRRVWDAMMDAGTPCPIDGKIGVDAKAAWDENPGRVPTAVKEKK
jgi:hypothetical protein